MYKFKKFNIVSLEGTKFTANDFKNSDVIIITNTTEANIKLAITIANSAESSQAVTVGILSGNINPINCNMNKFFNYILLL